jgi:hypothetical protein
MKNNLNITPSLKSIIAVVVAHFIDETLTKKND